MNSTPPNGAPNPLAIGGIGAMKLAAMTEARNFANGWIAAMKEHRMAAMGVVIAQHPSNDMGNFTLGYLDTELQAAGYDMTCLAMIPLGKSASGCLIFHISLLLRSKTGKAQSVILA